MATVRGHWRSIRQSAVIGGVATDRGHWRGGDSRRVLTVIQVITVIRVTTSY